MSHTASTYVRARVTTEAREESVVEHAPGLWHIRVREKPERGSANARVRALIARHLGVPEGTLRLIKGATSPSKTFLFVNTHAPCK
jgi:uncharacterized protein YggU (UPF0235/DUF167 family)